MPAFDFKCQKCKTVYEDVILQGQKLGCCPKCGSKRATKLFSTTAKIQVGKKGPQTPEEAQAAVKVVIAEMLNNLGKKI